jgi:hypothetical protein
VTICELECVASVKRRKAMTSDVADAGAAVAARGAAAAGGEELSEHALQVRAAAPAISPRAVREADLMWLFMVAPLPRRNAPAVKARIAHFEPWRCCGIVSIHLTKTSRSAHDGASMPA